MLIQKSICELDLNTSMMYRDEDYLKAIELVQEGKAQLKPLISARFTFEDYLSAYKYKCHIWKVPNEQQPEAVDKIQLD